MAGETVQYKRTVKGSVGAGMGALFNGSGRQFFILQHKDSSRYHQAGESQKIIIDQIELGRAKECQIRYDDETWPIVSRRHAAIEKDATGWKIVPLSQTNSTLVNGKVVNTAWYLQNGDEIQLSIGGPRLGFIVPAGNQSLVSSIKLTERLNLFREQALRPYKTAIGVLCSVLVLACCVGGYFIWAQNGEITALEDDLRRSESVIDELGKELVTKTEEIAEINKTLMEQNDIINAQNKAITDIIVSNANISEEAHAQALKSVYFIRAKSAKLILTDGTTGYLNPEKFPSLLYSVGTGFLLDDGRFVTARHVVDRVKFISSLQNEIDLVILNTYLTLGAKLEVEFLAISSNDSFTFTSHECVINNSTDQTTRINLDTNSDGANDMLTIASLDNTDWAYVKTNRRGTLKVNADTKQIKTDTKLIVLGYPNAYVTESVEALEGSCVIASNGLHEGLIVVTDRNFEPGNSGGPVLIIKPNRTAEVVGIVSSGYGDTIGHIVSITNLK